MTLPVEEATEGFLRKGVVLVLLLPITERARVVEAVGEVTFLVLGEVEVVVEARVAGTMDFLTVLGEVVEATEGRRVTPGVVGVARVVVVVDPGVARVPVVVLVRVVVAGLVVPGVLEARIGLAVGLETVDVRGVVDAVVVLAMGVFEAVETGFLAGAVVPARPAAANEDKRLFTLGESDISKLCSFVKKR